MENNNIKDQLELSDDNFNNLYKNYSNDKILKTIDSFLEFSKQPSAANPADYSTIIGNANFLIMSEKMVDHLILLLNFTKDNNVRLSGIKKILQAPNILLNEKLINFLFWDGLNITLYNLIKNDISLAKNNISYNKIKEYIEEKFSYKDSQAQIDFLNELIDDKRPYIKVFLDRENFDEIKDFINLLLEKIGKIDTDLEKKFTLSLNIVSKKFYKDGNSRKQVGNIFKLLENTQDKAFILKSANKLLDLYNEDHWSKNQNYTIFLNLKSLTNKEKITCLLNREKLGKESSEDIKYFLEIIIANEKTNIGKKDILFFILNLEGDYSQNIFKALNFNQTNPLTIDENFKIDDWLTIIQKIINKPENLNYGKKEIMSYNIKNAYESIILKLLKNDDFNSILKLIETDISKEYFKLDTAFVINKIKSSNQTSEHKYKLYIKCIETLSPTIKDLENIFNNMIILTIDRCKTNNKTNAQKLIIEIFDNPSFVKCYKDNFIKFDDLFKTITDCEEDNFPNKDKLETIKKIIAKIKELNISANEDLINFLHAYRIKYLEAIDYMQYAAYRDSVLQVKQQKLEKIIDILESLYVDNIGIPKFRILQEFIQLQNNEYFSDKYKFKIIKVLLSEYSEYNPLLIETIDTFNTKNDIEKLITSSDSSKEDKEKLLQKFQDYKNFKSLLVNFTIKNDFTLSLKKDLPENFESQIEEFSKQISEKYKNNISAGIKEIFSYFISQENEKSNTEHFDYIYPIVSAIISNLVLNKKPENIEGFQSLLAPIFDEIKAIIYKSKLENYNGYANDSHSILNIYFSICFNVLYHAKKFNLKLDIKYFTKTIYDKFNTLIDPIIFEENLKNFSNDCLKDIQNFNFDNFELDKIFKLSNDYPVFYFKNPSSPIIKQNISESDSQNDLNVAKQSSVSPSSADVKTNDYEMPKTKSDNKLSDLKNSNENNLSDNFKDAQGKLKLSFENNLIISLNKDDELSSQISSFYSDILNYISKYSGNKKDSLGTKFHLVLSSICKSFDADNKENIPYILPIIFALMNARKELLREDLDALIKNCVEFIPKKIIDSEKSKKEVINSILLYTLYTLYSCKNLKNCDSYLLCQNIVKLFKEQHNFLYEDQEKFYDDILKEFKEKYIDNTKNLDMSNFFSIDFSNLIPRLKDNVVYKKNQNSNSNQKNKVEKLPKITNKVSNNILDSAAANPAVNNNDLFANIPHDNITKVEYDEFPTFQTFNQESPLQTSNTHIENDKTKIGNSKKIKTIIHPVSITNEPKQKIDMSKDKTFPENKTQPVYSRPYSTNNFLPITTNKLDNYLVNEIIACEKKQNKKIEDGNIFKTINEISKTVKVFTEDIKKTIDSKINEYNTNFLSNNLDNTQDSKVKVEEAKIEVVKLENFLEKVNSVTAINDKVIKTLNFNNNKQSNENDNCRYSTKLINNISKNYLTNNFIKIDDDILLEEQETLKQEIINNYFVNELELLPKKTFIDKEDKDKFECDAEIKNDNGIIKLVLSNNKNLFGGMGSIEVKINDFSTEYVIEEIRIKGLEPFIREFCKEDINKVSIYKDAIDLSSKVGPGLIAGSVDRINMFDDNITNSTKKADNISLNRFFEVAKLHNQNQQRDS